LREILPGIADHLATDPAARKYAPGTATPASKDDASENSTNFSAIFKQLFCVAAQRLSTTIHEPLESIGVLFEEPLETGALHLNGSAKATGTTPMLSLKSRQSDVERDGSSSVNFGRGKYLFLIRRLKKTEVDKFAAMGYRFGSVHQIFDRLATAMEVPQDIMKTRLDRMKLFSSLEHLPSPGVHIACFMLRPSVQKSFDVLVPTKSQNLLPFTTIQTESLNEGQAALLYRFDEWTIKDILKTLINESGSQGREREFRWQLYSSLIRLLELVGDFDNLMNANFSARQIRIACRREMGTTGPTTCTLLTIRLMSTIHSRPQKDDMTYIPLSFFSAQQQVDSLYPDHEAFARRVKMEFGYRTRQMTDPSVPRPSIRSSRRGSLDQRHRRFPDLEVSTPTSFTRFKNALHSPSTRKSEESSIVRVRDVSVGASEEKSGSEMEDLDTIVTLPTPLAGTPTADVYHADEQDAIDDHRHLQYRYEHAKGDIELVAISAEQGGGSWVADLFGLFGLGQQAGQRG
jgi:hypothetical protein